MINPETTIHHFRINHQKIAQIIAEKKLGEIFIINLPDKSCFSLRDFTNVRQYFDRIKNEQILGTYLDLFGAEDFIISSYKNMIHVYKDTTVNVKLFKEIHEKVAIELEKRPDMYPVLMNMVLENIPEAERDGFLTLPYKGKTKEPHLSDLIYFEGLPTTVLKALWQLTNDPHQIVH